MHLSSKGEILLIGFAVFGVIAPVLIRIAAGIVGAEEITAWRCIKAGLLGFSGLAAAMKIGGEFHSMMAALVVMALIWMTWIQIVLKTTIPQTFGIWLITHGSIFLGGIACNHFFNVQSQILNLATKS